MKRDRAITILSQNRSTLEHMGVSALAIFGSVARDEAEPDSDVDVLVQLEPPVTFDRYMDVKLYLEDQLQTSVDLVTWKSLKPQIRDVVEQEAIYVS